MYSAIGRKVIWKGAEHVIRGMAPAGKVAAGSGTAALIIIGGQSIYINTKELQAI